MLVLLVLIVYVEDVVVVLVAVVIIHICVRMMLSTIIKFAANAVHVHVRGN